jgi:hypothetical protein
MYIYIYTWHARSEYIYKYTCICGKNVQNIYVLVCIIYIEARSRGVKKVHAWSDNGTHFHSSAILSYHANTQNKHNIDWEGNFTTPGVYIYT